MKPLRCALIGADTLLIECAQALRDRGHELVAVAAGSERVATWATQASVAVHDTGTLDQFANDLRERSVDYLFAITHLHLLPKSVVTAAHCMAINFHDGPLPGYAGLNTPVWGILRGEAEWGVTWHRIDAGVDTGDILVQRRFEIADRETSLSLNTRNFEEALDSFGDLLDLLEADDVTTVAQCGTPTATFRRADRPDGVLDFNQSAADVDRVVRALHFGPHPNPVAAAVLWSPLTALAVGASEVAGATNAAPGIVLAANDAELTVACSDNAIVLSNLRSLEGTPCSATQFLSAVGAGVGSQLQALSADQRQWLADFALGHQRFDATTIATFTALAAAAFPWPSRQHNAGSDRESASVPVGGPCTPERMVGALAVLLGRLTPDGGAHVALAQPPVPEFARSLICTVAVLDLNNDLAQDLGVMRTMSWNRDLVARTPRLSGRAELPTGVDLPIGVRMSRDDASLPHALVVLQPAALDGCWEVTFDTASVDKRDVVEFARCLAVTAEAFGGTTPPAEVSLLTAAALDVVVRGWNATDAPYESVCIHDLIARQAAATPQREAIVCGGEAVTYAQLTDRASRLAAHLQQSGVGPDSLVGVHVDRSIDLVVAVLAILQAGGAYVPLDPAYPADRLRHMVADSEMRVIVCQQKDRASLPVPDDGFDRVVVSVDSPLTDAAKPVIKVQPHNLAYCIYTSGSSGTPKGVLVEHRNVANLFAAMDAIVTRGQDDTWCAVTSLSFDISVLELLYTLARGIRIALYVPDAHRAHTSRKPMEFSLFYFSADEAADTGNTNDCGGKYRLLLEGARFADRNGFCAVWTPERHFHAFGGLYPNPAVTAAAIATVTERIGIRAGSVVLPLHHPVEVAEAWSMVDNLSNGRAGVSFASGWQPNDFVLRPQNYAQAKARMFEGIEQIRRLWRGESVAFEGPDGGAVEVATLPRPIQAELPMWITTAGNPDSFAAAGTAGTNLLTHLVGQSVDQLASKIATYRAARAAAGHDPATGVVTLMLHTFVSGDEATVRAAVREPLRQYLNTSYNLLREHAWAFPTFRRPDGVAMSGPDDLADDDMANLAREDLDAVLDFAAERYYETSGLFGTPDQVAALVERLHQIGVDEIACLIDFGIATDDVLGALPHLARVRDSVAAPTMVTQRSIADLVVESETTHIQCTPSMARMFMLDPAMRVALGTVRQMLVGGEALATDLAHDLHSMVGGSVTNMYGPTETTVWSSAWKVRPGTDHTSIGTPIANTQMYVLDNVGQPTPPGVAGHLWIGGAGVSRGYHARPDLTAERFLADPFRQSGQMYCTGDLARWQLQADGAATLEFVGRADQQVKLRGHRVELGEIENELRRLADVDDCAVTVSETEQLVAYVTTSTTFDARSAREVLRRRLPEVMVPYQIVVLPALPRTPNGKLDRRALPAQTRAVSTASVPAANEAEGRILADWQFVLGTSTIGVDDNFFDVGGHSLLVVRLHRRLQETLGRTVALTDLYRFPTVRTFTSSLAVNGEKSAAIETALDRAARRRASAAESVMSDAIAIVGMSLRVPGATTPSEYWNNLAAGVESITTLSDEQLSVAGVSRDAMQRQGYVRRAAPLDRMEWFDAEFFGFSPKDAAIMDPQHRQFLAACWEALEDAAHPASTFDGSIGVFGGCGMGAYLAFNLLSNRQLVDDVGMFLLRHTGNDKDFLVTRASYLLDLRGPAVNVQTACSTSLVATHLAVQNLLSGECDLALAGGVTIEIPHGRGYQYQPGEILSPDGHCRPFDADAAGTVFGSGVGVVVLRRLSDALADGDHIYALLRGTAINNDGARKVGYLAPSIDGQAACIAEALAIADIAPTAVGMVECHGTGTAMGDPIEIAALDQAFGRPSDGAPYCHIGSVKSNIGHLDTAAGVASLIKASLALQHRAIPPSLHFKRPNPNSVLEGSAFHVASELIEWPQSAGAPRRAGVNSLGVGGTNAFAVLEEAPAPLVGTPTEGPQLLVLSARNRAALDGASQRLAEHFDEHPDLELADVAHTLHAGRHQFSERRVVAASSLSEAARLLRSGDARRVFTHSAGSRRPPLIFLFPGGGTQYPQMAAQLYAAEPVFRGHVDVGLRLAKELHGIDLQPLLFASAKSVSDAAIALQDASLQLPALLIVEHALAQLLISWDVVPTALAGHSVGETVAACVAGTMTFADCLGLVVLRGKLMDRTRGGMLSVRMPAAELQPILDECGLDLGVINAPDLCVASGAEDGLIALEHRLNELGIEFTRVRINIAAHSRLLDPVLHEFRTYLKTLELSAPKIAWVSNQTGTWVTAAEATDPEYWVRQLRNTVDFAADIAAIAAQHNNAIFVEVGPGTTLCSLARLNPTVGARHGTVHTMHQPDEQVDDATTLLTALGRLWALGAEYPITQAYSAAGTGTHRRRLSLPTYAFQEQRYFIEPRSDDRVESVDPMLDRAPIDQWFWEPAWKPQSLDRPAVGIADRATTYLVFADLIGIADGVVARLRAAGHRVAVVRAGDSYRMIRPDEYLLAAEHGRNGYEQLVADLVRGGLVPDRVLNLALLAQNPEFRPGHSFFHRNQELGFYNLVFFMQAWAAEGLRRPLHLVVATTQSQKATAQDTVSWPEQSTVLGPLLVLPHELPDLTCVAVDMSLPSPKKRSKPDYRSVVDAISREAQAATIGATGGVIAAWRDGVRLVRTYERATSAGAESPFPLRRGGVVLITGGLGGIGLTIARQLHETVAARLVLLTRTPLPPEEQWSELANTLDADHPILARIRGLTALRADGAEVTVVHADVTNIARMRDVFAKIHATHGGLHGVVHAAGTIDDRPLLEKEQVDIERVLGAKVYGTLVLDELTRDQPLDLFVVFSSTSVITGPAGQLDYVAANAFLESFAQSRSDRVTAITWGAWSEVGMAVESVRRLLDDGRERPQPCAGPLFATRVSDASGEVTLSASWPADSWFLNEHRTAGGAAMFPGAGYLELARQALSEVGVHRAFELRELVMLAPLAAAAIGSTRVDAVLTPTDYGYSFEVRRVLADGRILDDEPSWTATAQAQIVLRSPAAAADVDIASIVSASPNRGPVRTRQQDHLRLGPRWKVARRVHTGLQHSVASLAVPEEFANDLESFVLHPALVDIGLCFAIEQVPGYTGDALWVPVSAQAIVVHHPAGPVAQLRCATVVATVRPGSSEAAGFATFDVLFIDSAGRAAITVTGFTMKRLNGRLNLESLPNETVAESNSPRARTITDAEHVLRQNVSQGIRAAEGAVAFERALTQHRGGSVVITALDPLALRAQVDRLSSAALHSGGESGVTFARPRLNSAFVAPRNAIERTLTELWQELLGISEVGVHDSFFDLGGHSLIAVRLFARIRKLFSVDLPISALFTAQTVEAGAALISSMLPTADSGGTQSTTPPSVYTYLVPMHSRDDGATTPFFLVAGMFGNVLNLRHLSNQIGTDRPFYGLQARGLFGGDKPHETFEEMAAAYLQEIREVQPHGPYLLGGFSGGGITALEMARQLHADGEQVGLLVMLDTPAPSMRQPLTIADKIAIQLQNIARYKFGYVQRWWRNRQDWKRDVVARQQVAVPEAGMQHSVDIEAAFLRALDRYDVGRYEGEITLYRPLHPVEYRLPGRRGIDDRRDFVQDDNGWRRHCAHVEIVNVPGDHDSMVLEPHVRVLAEAIRGAIEAAEQ